jgi:hypothetical protein
MSQYSVLNGELLISDLTAEKVSGNYLYCQITDF